MLRPLRAMAARTWSAGVIERRQGVFVEDEENGGMGEDDEDEEVDEELELDLEMGLFWSFW